MGNPSSRSLGENWQAFKDALHRAITTHVPTKNSKTKHDLPCITRDIRGEIRKKDRYYHKARQSKKQEDWFAYCVKRQNIQKLVRSAHDDNIWDVIGASLIGGGNQKKFWSFVKLSRTENMGIPILSDILLA